MVTLRQVTLHLHVLNQFFQAGQKDRQKTFYLLAFFNLYRNKMSLGHFKSSLPICSGYLPFPVVIWMMKEFRHKSVLCSSCFCWLPRKCLIHLIFVTRCKTRHHSFTFNILSSFYSSISWNSEEYQYAWKHRKTYPLLYFSVRAGQDT